MPAAERFLLGLRCPAMIQKSGLIWLAYNLLFAVVIVLAAPFYLWKMWRRGNWRPGFFQRFGIYDRALKARLRAEKPIIWMHAVSVGEVNLGVALLKELRARMPDHRWLVSTTTSTGMAELQRRLPDDVEKIYYPIDFDCCVRSAMRAISPQMIVLVEAEMWPNLVWMARDRGIPVSLVNARLSGSSYRGYLRAAFLFAPLYGSLAAVGAQTEGDVERWVRLGCRPDRVHVTGNIKFDSVATDPPGLIDAGKILRDLGVGPEAKIIVGGSTHAGEERILAEAFVQLAKEIDDLFLVVVPRHMERGSRAASDIADAGLRVVRRSEIAADSGSLSCRPDCLLVDSTGELMDFYDLADVVFVGKSITAKGGQNPLEPAALGKPVVFGPNMGNFREIVRILLNEKGAEIVGTVPEIVDRLRKILTEPAVSDSMGQAARQAVGMNRGSLRKTGDLLVNKAYSRIWKKPLDPHKNIT